MLFSEIKPISKGQIGHLIWFSTTTCSVMTNLSFAGWCSVSFPLYRLLETSMVGQVHLVVQETQDTKPGSHFFHRDFSFDFTLLVKLFFHTSILYVLQVNFVALSLKKSHLSRRNMNLIVFFKRVLKQEIEYQELLILSLCEIINEYF